MSPHVSWMANGDTHATLRVTRFGDLVSVDFGDDLHMDLSAADAALLWEQMGKALGAHRVGFTRPGRGPGALQ